MNDYSDRRTEHRKHVTTFILVQDSQKGVLLGYLRDLTLSGARVNGNKIVKVNIELPLSFELPCTTPKINSGTLSIPARVTRCDKVIETPESYDIGFEFTALKTNQAELIQRFLSRYHF